MQANPSYEIIIVNEFWNGIGMYIGKEHSYVVFLQPSLIFSQWMYEKCTFNNFYYDGNLVYNASHKHTNVRKYYMIIFELMIYYTCAQFVILFVKIQN